MTKLRVEEQGVSFFKDIDNNRLNSLETIFQEATLPIVL